MHYQIPINALIIANYFSLLQKKWHIIYLQLQVQVRARKFYAADCSLVLRSRCIARRLICTHHPALRTDQPDMHPPALPALRAPDAPLLLHYESLHPGLQHPASAKASAGTLQPLSPPGRGLLRPSTRGTDGLARGSEGSSTRGGGRRGNDRGFWRHQRQWMECRTRFSLKI